MADNQARVVLSAVDQSSAAFASFKRNLTGVGEAAQNVGGLISGIGSAAAVVAITGMVRRTADYADEMGKLAQKAGVTTEAISGLAYAAKLSDVDNQALAKGLRSMALDAADGGEKLSALGVSLLDAAGKAKTSDQLFLDVADKLSGIEDPGKRAAAAAKLFGERVGPELLPLLLSGSEGIKGMTDEARRFGKVITDEASAKAQEFNDNLTRLGTAAEGVAGQLFGPLIVSLANSSSYFIKVANDAGIAKAALISFGGAVARTLGLDDVGRLESAARANQNAIALTVKQIETFQRLADRGDAAAATRVATLRQQFAQLQADGQRLTSQLKGEAASIDAQYKPVAGSPLGKPETPEQPKPNPSRGGAASAGAPFTGLTYDEQITQRVGKLFEGADITKAKEYSDTLAKLDELYFSGAIGSELYDSAVNKLTGSTAEAGKSSTELADQQARLAQLLAGTASAALEEQRNDMLLLAAAFEKGTITARQFEEAATARLGLTGPAAKAATESFSETLHGDVKDALSQAFRDTKNPVEAFGNALYNVVLTRVTSGLANSIADGLLGKDGGGGGLLSGVSDWFSNLLPSANGNVFPAGPGISAYSSQVVSKPTIFPFAKGVGLMGEAGAEAIMPLRRDSAGRLGVSAAGASVTVNVINQSGQAVGAQQRSRSGANGEQIVDVVLTAIGESLANRSGPVARGLESGYGLRPAMA